MASPASTHDVQAAAEGVTLPAAAGTDVDVVGGALRVEFMGEKFRVAEKLGAMPLLQYANAAREGLDSDSMEGLAAMYAMIRDCIADDEWKRFERHATSTRADQAELLNVVTDVVAILTARPTVPPGDSSPGRPATSANSKAQPGSQDIRHLELVSVDTLVDLSTA